ncbi:MAG: hypothetical protein AAFZ02_12090, partial [Pseudomonadota bacterium]
ATWGYDVMVFGQSELSEAMVQVIEGWAMWRSGLAEDLSAGHPYRATPPTMSDADLGTRYHFDAEAWGALWARNPRQVREAFRGQPLPEVTDHVPVFLDDFRAARVARSDQIGNGRDPIWYAPGWNGSVGKAARMADPDRAPELYAHNAAAQTLTLSIGHRGDTWLASAIYSVNDAGQGHSWEGEAIYRVRVRLPRLAGPPDVGHFPAIPWFYNLEHLFWRTGERIEIDAFEFEGIDPFWINGGSSHVHSGQYPGRFGHLSEDAPRGKIIGDRLDLNIWDGMFHDWEMRIGREVTILGLDGLEIARIETPPEYLERLYMIADYALKPGPEPDRERPYGMEIDRIEVLQPASHLARLPAAFEGHPVVSLSEDGATAQCTARFTVPVSDIRYAWFAQDGYPLGFGPDPRRVLAPSKKRTGLRCMVRAVGLVDQPEAWSALFALP